jgi:hypothetical protein
MPQLAEQEVDAADRERGSLLRRAAQFYKSSSLQSPLEVWVRDHVNSFKHAAAQEAKTGEIENELKFTELHEEYLSLFESLLEQFIAQEHSSSAEFFSECQDALNDQYCALFEEHEFHGFAEMLASAVQYEAFLAMMLKEAHSVASASRRK